MRIFAKQIMEEVSGKQQTFEKLSIDGTCLLDLFEIEIKPNKQLYSEYKTILAYMSLMANGLSLPQAKFREIKGGNLPRKQYEFKSKHLRIYALDNNQGKLIILGGYKTSQEKDIKQLNIIAKEYILNERK